jgi:hypothetical protein
MLYLCKSDDCPQLISVRIECRFPVLCGIYYREAVQKNHAPVRRHLAFLKQPISIQ